MGAPEFPQSHTCIVRGIGIRGDKTQSIYEKPLNTNTIALYGFDIFKIGIDCPKKIIKNICSTWNNRISDVGFT